MRTTLFDPAKHDPRNPNPWMAVYLDGSLPIADDVKRAWLTDCASRSRQWLLPLVRPLAKLAVILVQLDKNGVAEAPDEFDGAALAHR